jgi:cytochrome c oxidase cbb3-type subunit 1
MSAIAQAGPRPYGRAIALHSLGWLAAANLVGVWLAISLLWPAAGDWIAPLSYGRWSALHLDWQLYGWCALPIVGALFAWCFDDVAPVARRDANLALAGWSLALLAGGVAWLGGNVSGKLFLDWHGWTRPLLPLAMLLLWVLLTGHTCRRWSQLARAGRVLRVAVLGALFLVPPILFWSSGRNMYQSVNPDSGGATGAALLGSTLGIITIFMLLPLLVGIRAERGTKLWWWALGGSWIVFALTDRGHVSHHVGAQILALAVLLAWMPLLPWYWRRFAWPEGARSWIVAASAWWTLLVLTGWISFLPGVSEALKYTHALVAHAHLAMAGLVTSVNAALLVVFTGRRAPRSVAWLWQGGCAVYVVSMMVLGWVETTRLGELYRSEAWTQALLGVRLGAGVAMAAASVRWLGSFLRA